MFESATFESKGTIKTRSRSWAVLALALNGAVVASLVIVPLIYPEALPPQTTTVLLTAPLPPAEISETPRTAVAAQSSEVNRINQTFEQSITAPSSIPTTIANVIDGGPPSDAVASIGLPSGGGGIPGGFGKSTSLPVVVATPSVVRLPSQISIGSIIQKTIPTYSPIARAAHVQGTVTLDAVISTAGMIEKLRVLGGPALLQQSAIDAVKTWRYRPYLLNGSPVEVETQVNVVFTLDN